MPSQVQLTSVFLPEQKRTSAAVSKLMDEFLWVVLGLILNRGDHTPPTPICRLITDILHKNYKLIASDHHATDIHIQISAIELTEIFSV